jgi:hypothetical protein
MSKIGETAKKLATNKWVWIGAAGALGLYLFMKSRSSSGSNIQVVTSFKPAAIGVKELVSADKYRLIESRRPGMTYVPVTSGDLGGKLEFASPSSGKFTWNVIKEGSTLYAEIGS